MLVYQVVSWQPLFQSHSPGGEEFHPGRHHFGWVFLGGSWRSHGGFLYLRGNPQIMPNSNAWVLKNTFFKWVHPYVGLLKVTLHLENWSFLSPVKPFCLSVAIFSDKENQQSAAICFFCLIEIHFLMCHFQQVTVNLLFLSQTWDKHT